MAMLNSRSRFTDILEEPVSKLIAPIRGYQNEPLIPLEKTIEPVAHLFNGIEANAWVAKENCRQPKEGLTQDESAAIHLYTMQFDGGPSLFEVLNRILRAEDRQRLKPWFAFIKLFFTALHKLPGAQSVVIWRGLCGVNLSSIYTRGKKIAWWGVSSCTTNLKVLEANHFMGKTGIRTLFSIECQNGKSVTRHSYFKDKEEEVILMPGTYLEVMSQANPAEGLHIIHLKEIDPPFPLVAPPFVKNATSLQNTVPRNVPSFASSNGKKILY